jgi:coenzyme PQQ precursor peptide PqqA
MLNFSEVVEERSKRGTLMEWTKPEFEEISLNCEINSYAKAEL